MNSVCCLQSLLVVILQIVNTQEVYQNQFAVHIPAGSQAADQIARRNGLINSGQIGDLDNYFLFISPRLKKRSITRCSEHEEILKNETDIHWFSQQKQLRRKKRDVHLPEITDPLFKDQWYLNHGAKDGSDMNIKGAWKLGYTGKGVVVTILDDGIQHDHPDLAANYDKLASKDINSDDDDPMPQDNGENKHGTRCAGEVAAVAFNDYCGVGIAYNSSIGGVRMLDGIVNDVVEARGLSLNPSHIDIYSASWGPEDDGKTVDGPGPLALKAFTNGITKGRDGKGSIFVWASGNGGRHTDNCNCDGYTNSVYTLSISSATQGGLKPWYLEECSSTLATTYSSGTPGQDASITTVDQDKRLRKNKLCTSGHTGTSASAPLAAGVIALALEANPRLTWRDMQHLVVYTSNPGPLQHESGWESNSVGRNFSHKFGYGLLDGESLVRLAVNWKTVPDQHICQTRVEDVQKVLPREKGMKLSVNMITDGCDNMINKVRYLEHVQCIISLQYPPRGFLKISLRSPRGTVSYILLPRPQDRVSSGFEDWPFLSVHFWGEDPTGEWILDIENAGTSNAKSDGILKHWQLVLHGTSTNPYPNKQQEKFIRPNEEETEEEVDVTLSDKADLKLSSTPKSKCSSYGLDGRCVDQCSTDQYFSLDHVDQFGMSGRMCKSCDVSCSKCYGPNSWECTECPHQYFYIKELSECVKECPSGYTRNSKLRQCIKCSENCQECHLQTKNPVCLLCKDGYSLHEDECVLECPIGYFSNNKTCSPCHNSCLTCTGGLDTQCGQCKSGTFYFQRRCVSYCPPGYFSQGSLNECMSCPHGCDHCSGPDGACTRCKKDWIKSATGECLPPESRECQPGMYSGMGTCLACHYTCKTCVGPKDQDCSSCYPDHRLLISTCVETCPDRYRPSKSIRSCQPCPHACKSCDQSNCTDCLPGYVLNKSEGSCQVNCPSGYFKSEDGVCQTCHSTCLECQGPGSNHCVSCNQRQGYMLAGGECTKRCPKGFFQDGSSCVRCHTSCAECTGPEASNCTVCHQNKVLQENYCTSCEPGYYLNLSEQGAQCTQCHASCSTCTGPAKTQCASCKGDLQLDSWSNSCVPCCTTFQESGTSCCLCGSSGLCTSPARLTRSLVGSSTLKGFFLGLFGVIFISFAILYFTSTRGKCKSNIRKLTRLIRQGEEYCKIPVNPSDLQDQKPFISDSPDCSEDSDDHEDEYHIVDS